MLYNIYTYVLHKMFFFFCLSIGEGGHGMVGSFKGDRIGVKQLSNSAEPVPHVPHQQGIGMRGVV